MQSDTLNEPPLEIDSDLCHAVAAEYHLKGVASEAETFYRAALALSPSRPDSWANLGMTVLESGRVEEAFQCQREALRLDPGNADVHNNMGIVAHTQNALAEAENHFRGALHRDPGHANATLNLGAVRQALGFLSEAESLYRRALDLGTDPQRAHNNIALVTAEQGRLEEAEQACRAALAIDPSFAEAKVNLAMILLMQGRLTEAWPHYEARWSVPPLRGQAKFPDHTRWRGGQSIAGKTILLHAEQGFGDTLHFCRYASMVSDLGATVLLSVPRALADVMRTQPRVDRVVSQDEPAPDHDLHCPLMSLPMAFDTSVETIPWSGPYLHADPAAAAAFEANLPARDGKKRIGLVWAGGSRPEQTHAAAIDKRRSMRLADMAPLAEVPDCAFVSLQLGPPLAQLRDKSAPLRALDLSERLTSFADTAALIETLDLVIAVDTAVAHLAGAMGKPVWLLSRFDACWRWLRDRDDTPWYPSMRLFRQTRPGDWAGVMTRVVAALAG